MSSNQRPDGDAATARTCTGFKEQANKRTSEQAKTSDVQERRMLHRKLSFKDVDVTTLPVRAGEVQSSPMAIP
jgi:hypothetical protein